MTQHSLGTPPPGQHPLSTGGNHFSRLPCRCVNESIFPGISSGDQVRWQTFKAHRGRLSAGGPGLFVPQSYSSALLPPASLPVTSLSLPAPEPRPAFCSYAVIFIIFLNLRNWS